jgi:redox-sensitive bicupin YhaK (pirin superfamily)
MQKNHQLRECDAFIGGGEASGFFGRQWREEPGSGAVLLCDSYVMTAPTFPLHPHKHISAVAILFEDTVGQMYSSDSVGTNHHFGAGDVHWTLAGSGVEHTQTPENGARIHAVQMSSISLNLYAIHLHRLFTCRQRTYRFTKRQVTGSGCWSAQHSA